MAWRAIIEPPGLSDVVVGALTKALFRIDLDYLLRHPETPPLYQSGVRYRAEPSGDERWLSVPHVLAAGLGDCEDLGCWRAAELVAQAARSGRFDLAIWLRQENEHERQLPARPGFRSRALSGGSGNVYHIITAVGGGGQTEDPSRRLGMR